jgi:antitoxin component of RelBE/YafQ-DinJ toxin-antitoxin module
MNNPTTKINYLTVRIDDQLKKTLEFKAKRRGVNISVLIRNVLDKWCNPSKDLEV